MNWLVRKDRDAGKDWRQNEKEVAEDEMVRWHHWLSSVQFSRSVVSDALWPHGLQHARPPCPSPTPRVCSNSCPLSRWCYLTISSPSPTPFNLSHHQSLSNESAFHIGWPNYWSFSTSPSTEYSGLISFRMDWFDLLAVQEISQESSPAPQFESINSLALNLIYGLTLISIHD